MSSLFNGLFPKYIYTTHPLLATRITVYSPNIDTAGQKQLIQYQLNKTTNTHGHQNRITHGAVHSACDVHLHDKYIISSVEYKVRILAVDNSGKVIEHKNALECSTALLNTH